MSEELQMVIDMAEESMINAIDHLDKELGSIRAGKANPRMLDSIQVECYGALTPLAQVASVSTPDARTIVIQPWDKSVMGNIERAIINSNIGLNPDNNGDIIRLGVPALTEERRKALVKDVSNYGEKGKVGVRNARRDANDTIKKMQKAGEISEDMEANAYDNVQEKTNSSIKSIEQLVKKKEEEVLTV